VASPLDQRSVADGGEQSEAEAEAAGGRRESRAERFGFGDRARQRF
jgi:hypothetical protein